MFLNCRKLWNSFSRRRKEVIILQRKPLVALQSPFQQKQDSGGTGPELLLNSLVKGPQVGVTSADATTTRPTGNPRLISGSPR